jgi:hypothetical protein
MNLAAIINAILNALKISWPIQFAVLAFSSVVLFMPISWSLAFGVEKEIKLVRPICFFTGLLAGCLLFAHLITIGVEKWNHRKIIKI